MIQRLFVYGTLGPGRVNEHILTQIGGTWEEAYVHGDLKSKGWGAEMGFPGIVLTETDKEVHGFIFSSENLKDSWEELDEFEGEEYCRVVTKVTNSSGQKVEAYIYVLGEM